MADARHSALSRWALAVLCGVASAPALVAHAAEPVDPAAAAEKAAAEEFARYRPVSVAWVPSRAVREVRGVFPHPADPMRVALTTAGGLRVSEDAGKTWRGLPAAAPEKVGAISHVAYRPDSMETFYLATAGGGVWVTEDGGTSFRQVGSTRGGLASDQVLRVMVWPDDPHFRTLLAFHGEAAAGISRSFNGGRSWHVVARDYIVRRAFPAIRTWGELSRIFVIASPKRAPGVETAYVCSALSGLWREAFRDIVFTDGALSFERTHVYIATADRGLHRVDAAGGAQIGPPGASRFASVGVTWGPRADKELLYAYEPRKLGLLLSTDGMRSFTAHNRGLYVGPFVKEGAHVRASANGGRFFAVVNGALYVGYVRTSGVSVTQARVTPAVFTYRRTDHEKALADFHDELYAFRSAPSAAAGARALLAKHAEVEKTFSSGQLQITARAFALGDKPEAVTVDLSALQGPADAPMHDDGRHGDGDAGDKVYGAAFDFDPRNLRDPRTRQMLSAGQVGLSVKARTDAGALGGAVAVLSVHDRPEHVILWADGHANPLHAESGDVECPPRPGPDEAFVGRTAMKLKTGKQPWCAALGPPARRPWNIAGYHAVSFWVKADRAAEMFFQLRDAPEFDRSSASRRVALVAGRYVEGGALAGEYRRAVVPLADLLKEVPGFRVTRLGQLLFSGEGGPATTIWIDKVCLHVNAESVEKEREAPRDLPGRRRPRR